MANARIDPLRNFRFRLEVGNLKQAEFAEVMIGETTVDAVDYRVGNDPPHVRKLSGLTKYGTITLKWGITTGANALELFNWHKDVSTGQVKESRKDVAIVVMDEAGTDAARFVVSNAWPAKYDPSDLNGKGNEVLIELLELVNEGIERTI
jgi:phage tail-like protein